MVVGRPRRKSAKALLVLGEEPGPTVRPPVKVKPPRNPTLVLAWLSTIEKCETSAPKRMLCGPFTQLTLADSTKKLSRNRKGFDAFVFPSDVSPLTAKTGMPPDQMLGPLVPGIPRTLRP